MWIFIILIIGVLAGLLIWGSYFPSIGRTEGIVSRVEVEIDENHGRRGHHTDPRSYRVYIKYEWEGRRYEAKSFAAYSMAKYFPGNDVKILIHKTDKGIVKIIG